MSLSFSSGPCKKRKGWDVGVLKNALVGRSHRSKECKDRIQEVMRLQREVLKLPSDYKIGVIMGSDTAAIESALWNLLGYNEIDCIVFDAFSKKWHKDINESLRLQNRKFEDEVGVDSDRDIVFALNGTTSGKCLNDLSFIKNNRKGLTICDATSGIFAVNIDWEKIDVLTYSWQKCLGGEAGTGIIICSPRTFERLEKYIPTWPIPSFMNLRSQNVFGESIPINTISMLNVEDVKDALLYAKQNNLIEKCKNNSDYLYNFVDSSNFYKNNIIKKYRSPTAVTFTIDDKEKIDNIILDLKNKGIFDLKSYKDEPSGFRVWCGPTIELDDLKFLCNELKKYI